MSTLGDSMVKIALSMPAKGALIGAPLGGIVGGINGLMLGAQLDHSRMSKKQRRNLYMATGLGGAGLGAVMGGVGTYQSIKDQMNREEMFNNFRNGFGGFGREGFGGGRRGGYGGARGPRPAPEAPASMPDWLKGAKTKAEAKSRFREQARKNHPDMGGSHAGMQNVNAAWEAAQKHRDFPKHAAQMGGFTSELLAIIAAVG